MQPTVFTHPPFSDYGLLDSGDGHKLERFGSVVLRRPDPQALWRPRLDPGVWSRADLNFVRESDRGGRWEVHSQAAAAARGRERQWEVGFESSRFLIRPTSFKHVGLFPEQATNWVWVHKLASQLGPKPTLLNLFGYTGAASVLAAKAGFSVTHVDASKSAVTWVRENAEASGLAPNSLRLLVEDALTFVQRERRRGKRYAGILLDPPHYGRGPKGEKWQFESGLVPLLEVCADLLEERAFLILSTYAIGYSPLALFHLLSELEGGSVQVGELALPELGLGDESGIDEATQAAGETTRHLPCGFCARWWRGVESST